MPKRLISNAAPAAVAKKADLGIEREIAAAAQRIRWQDGFTGLAAMAVIALSYAIAMVLLDRWLQLPQWVRQLGFLGFIASLGTVAYFFIVRPLQKSVNPRFIARQLEGTQSETKNEIINWVDMREKDIPGSIRDAVDAKAAEGLAEADVNTAIRSGKLPWLGGTAMVLFGVLAVLFLIFKASMFTSLLGRAFNPFQSTAIGTRTKIELAEPQPADTAITDGEQLRFLVNILGKKPSADGPDRVRLLLKQSQDDTQYEEIPFTLGTNSREFDLTLGRSAIRNGFWYKVAAGDAETEEHRIDVRTRPLIAGFEARYEYPAYTRMVPDIGREPKIEAHRGTIVTLTVKTNRNVKSGSIAFDGKPSPIAGEVVPEAKDSLRFRFKIEERTNYRIQFASVENESSGFSPPYPIEVILDRAPAILIDAPAEEEIALPVNGLLAVDAAISDDFGLDTATLVLRIPQENGAFAEVRKKYLDGQSLKREKDGIFPISLKYKDSIKLDGLKTVAGVPLVLKPELVLEYWVESTDNCTEPKPNLGKSDVKRVKLTPPPMAPEEKKEQEQKAGERQNDEKNQQQGEKTKREKDKPQKPQQRQDRQPEKKEDPGAEDQPDPMNPMDGNPMGNGQEKPNDPMNPMNGGGEKPNPDEVKRQADKIQNNIDKQNEEGSDTKPDPNDEQDPMMGESKPGESKPKGEKPKPENSEGTKNGDPMGGGSESKDPGKVQNPENSQEKPKPNESGEGDKEKPEPRGGQTAGEEKSSQPKEGQEPGEGKNAEPKPEEGQAPEKTPKTKVGKTKPDGQPKPGQEKPSPNGEQAEEKTAPQEQPGEAKNEKPTKSGSSKGGPKEPPMGNKPGEEKSPPEAGTEQGEAGSEKGKGQDKAPPMGGSDPKGAEKPSKPSPGKGGQGQEKEPTKEEREQFEKDIKDLNSPDDNTRKEAEKRVDDKIGKENRQAAQKKAEQLEKDLKSDDKEKRDAAQGELQRLAEENAKKQKRDPKQGDAEQLQKDAKDLASENDKTREDAEKRVDDKIGKEKREELQKKAKDTKKDRESGDPDQKAKAEKELKDQTAKAGDGGKPDESAKKEPTKEELEQFQKDAKDLNSPDEKTRKDAEDRLDKKIGKENREAAQKKANELEKDLKSENPDTKAKAEQELKDLAKKAGGGKPDDKAKEPTQEELEQFQKDAADLANKDEQKRKDAEKKLDEQIGKEKREELQKDMQDLASTDPKTAEDAKKRLEDKMKEQAKKQGDRKQDTAGNGGKGPDGKPIDDNAENRLKTAERQLEQFKKYRGNKEFLKGNNMTEEEYEKFLKGYEAMVAQQKDQVENEKVNPPSAQPVGPTTVGSNDGSGGRVEGKPNATGVEGPGGSGVAPPGYNEAQGGFTIPRRPKK